MNHFWTAHELLGEYQQDNLRPTQVVASLLERISKYDPKIHSYVFVASQKAVKEAEAVEEKKRQGALAGIPIVIKDNICVAGEATTCASKILEGFHPPYHATVIQKLQDAGAIFMGKSNMDEFAFGSSCETSVYGPTRNPWLLDRIPGGSSGGSAAAVSAGLTVMALGSDTGGSIRQPAAMCGIVGLKPTYGRVSRYGLIAFASSLDQIGPMTRDVGDCALLMNVIAGYDSLDSTSVNLPVPDYTKSLVRDLQGIRIGVPKEYFIGGMDPEVEKTIKEAMRCLEKLGVKLENISLPNAEHAISVYYIVAPAEASSNLARFDGVQYGYRVQKPVTSNQRPEELEPLKEMYFKTRGEGFGKEAKRRIILGTYALSSGYYSAYYLRAQKVRTLIKQDFDKAFQSYDCIVTPTSPTAAFHLGEKMNDPLQMYLSDIYTISINLAGIPAISIPCGFTKEGLPVGLQFLAKPFGEEALFRVAYAYEQVNEWHKMHPRLE